jgi:hypothetical protein
MWKLTFSMLAIVAAAALTALVGISSIGRQRQLPWL